MITYNEIFACGGPMALLHISSFGPSHWMYIENMSDILKGILLSPYVCNICPYHCIYNSTTFLVLMLGLCFSFTLPPPFFSTS